MWLGPVGPSVDACAQAKCEYCGRYGALGRCEGCGAPNRPVSGSPAFILCMLDEEVIDVTTHGDPRPRYIVTKRHRTTLHFPRKDH